VPTAPRLIQISFFAALGVAFALWALAMAMFAGWRGLQVSGAPDHLPVVMLILCVILGGAAVLVRRGNSWACFVPIGCLLALAVVWVRYSISGTVSVVAIVVALVLAGALVAVWVVPGQVRAFYAATDEYLLGRRTARVGAFHDGIGAHQNDAKAASDGVPPSDDAETVSDEASHDDAGTASNETSQDAETVSDEASQDDPEAISDETPQDAETPPTEVTPSQPM